ncbi:MAG: IS110 family transposase, partial [Nitrosotalea sp.]
YVGMDAHSATISVEVLSADGKTVNRSVMETNPEQVMDFFRGMSGIVHVTFEEGAQAAWLYEIIKPLVAEVIVCNPRENKLIQKGNKSDKIDAHKLASLLRMGELKPVYHDTASTRGLKEAVRSYSTLAKDTVRVMNRIKAIYRGRAIACKGTEVYRPKTREEWLNKLADSNTRNRIELLYRELDCLSGLRKEARVELIKQVRRQPAYKILKEVPGLGAIRIGYLIAIVSTPFRFRTKRQFWPYCGLAVVTCSSSDYEFQQGKLCRVRKPIGTRGLNRNYNRELKYVFKSAALHAKSRNPFKPYYERLIANKMKPELARVTLARKIAAITLAVWKKGECFDADKLMRQA